MWRKMCFNLQMHSWHTAWRKFLQINIVSFSKTSELPTRTAFLGIRLKECCLHSILGHHRRVYLYILGVARYMYSYRTVMVRASLFGAWGFTTNTDNSPPIQKGAQQFDNTWMPWVAHLKIKSPRHWPCADSERVSHMDWQRSILFISAHLTNPNIPYYFHICDVTYLNAKLLFIMYVKW